jgi:uncharacterized membrane protein HdeD (DUF308 family)
MTLTPTYRSLGEASRHLQDRWGWIVAFGILSIILGVVALGLIVSATIASVLVVGIFMIITGGTEIVLGFSARSWGRFFLWIAAGLLYLVAGAFVVSRPLVAAAFFTLLLGVGFLALGVVRLWVAFEMPSGYRTLPMISGLVSALLGILIIAAWPANSLFVLGMLLGIDLIFYGFGWLGFGFALRRISRAG